MSLKDVDAHFGSAVIEILLPQFVVLLMDPWTTCYVRWPIICEVCYLHVTCQLISSPMIFLIGCYLTYSLRK